MSKIIEKRFKILTVGKKNKNHRAYTDSVTKLWIDSENNKPEETNEGFDLEYAIDDDEERNIYNEFVTSSLNCGVVNGLRVEEDDSLTANVKFKLPESCNNLTKNLYEDTSFLEKIAIVPKGKGSVKNQTVQDDYELYGFNIILLEDSSFHEEEEKVEAQS